MAADVNSSQKGSRGGTRVGLGVFLIVVAVLAVVIGKFGIPQFSAGGFSPPSSEKEKIILRGVIGSEKEDFFNDPELREHLGNLNVQLSIETAGSREIASDPNLEEYDFVFPSSAPAAEKIARDMDSAAVTYPFYSPMAVATFDSIIQDLDGEGVISSDGGTHYLNVDEFLKLNDDNVRWRDISDEFASPRAVSISTTDIRSSSSAMMYLSLIYWLKAQEFPDQEHDQEFMAEAIAPYFVNQGYTSSTSAEPFNDYLSQGLSGSPLVLIYEAQYLGELMKEHSRLGDQHELLFLDPTIQAKHGMVGISGVGKDLADMFSFDHKIQEIAAKHGFRPQDPEVFSRIIEENRIAAPPESMVTVDPPAFDRLEAIVDAVSRRVELRSSERES